MTSGPENKQPRYASSRTRALVGFYAWDGFTTDPIASHPNFGHIIGVQTQKTLGGASGSFSITVKKPESFGSRPLTSLWTEPENVWVLIQFVTDGVVHDSMLGLIDSVNDDMVRSGGGMRSETFTITGRDFGKVFETTEIFIDQFLGGLLRSMRAMSTVVNTGLIGTPAYFVQLLYDLWVGNSGVNEKQWLLPPSLVKKYSTGDSFYSMVHLAVNKMTPERDGIALQKSLISPDQNGTKLWDMMQAVSNGVLNEMFVDMCPSGDGDGRMVPALVFRERPFPSYAYASGAAVSSALAGTAFGGLSSVLTSTLWNSLPEEVLDAGDVMSRSLAKGGAAQRFNFWVMRPSIATTFGLTTALTKPKEGVKYGFPGNIPIVNYDSVRRHGLRRWEQATDYVPFYTSTPQADQAPEIKEKSPDEWLRLAADWTARVHDWYCIAPRELSGTITTTRLLPRVRIGTRVKEHRPDGAYHYYVEAVSHSWTYPNAGQTTISVTRGAKEDTDLLREYYEETRFGAYPNTSDPLYGIDELSGGVDLDVALDSIEADADTRQFYEGSTSSPPLVAGTAGGMIRPENFEQPIPYTATDALKGKPSFPPAGIDVLKAGQDSALNQEQLESGQTINVESES